MSVKQMHAKIIGTRVVEQLRKKGFTAHYAADRAAACALVLAHVSPGTRVGLPGSMTVRELGLPEAISERGGVILDHSAPQLTSEAEREAVRQQQQSCDLFLCSSNAVTRDGSLVNLDGTGNRVSAMIYGPKKVVIVAGVNKIVKDIDEAYHRLENLASPLNNLRLQTPNPCTSTGFCVDCGKDTCICNVYTIMKRRPRVTDVEVIIIGEDLGY